jgi:hypothetical protein
MTRAVWLVAFGCVVSSSCVLSDFHKVASNDHPSFMPDGGTTPREDAAPMSARLAGASDDCNACVAAQCAQPLADCGADCAGLTLPITPATSAPNSVVPVLACLKQQCDDSCHVIWGCVNHYKWPAPAAPFTIDLQVSDLLSSSQRISGANVLACLNSDPGCNAGSGLVAQGISDLVGHVSLTVPRNFSGYFLVTPSSDDYMAAVGLWSQPAYWVASARTQPLVSWAVADYLAMGTDTKVDRAQAHLIFQALNCLPLRLSGNSMANAQADDVKVTYFPPAKDSSQVFYTITTSAIDRTRDRTSSAGGSFGGVFNLPPQSVTVVGQHDGVEVSRAVVQMRKGAVGFVFLLPTPML